MVWARFRYDIVYYEEADGTPCYSRIRGNTLFMLWTDESGFYTEIEEIDLTNRDRNARFWHVSLWNDPYFKPLAGIRNQTYPQNFGWSIKGSTEVLRITDLTTSRITKMLTYPKTKPPNCQKALEALLSIPQQLANGIPWRESGDPWALFSRPPGTNHFGGDSSRGD